MSERARALEQTLRELTAMVRGECPSLLNEDSGGNGDLSCQIEKLLAVPPPSGASPQATGGYIHHSLTDWIPTPECDCDRCTSARKSAPKPTGGASPQAETSEDRTHLHRWHHCPNCCGMGCNSHERGGNERCWHCALCAFVECVDREAGGHPAPVSPVEPTTDLAIIEKCNARARQTATFLSNLEGIVRGGDFLLEAERQIAAAMMAAYVMARPASPVEPEPPDMRLADVREACAALGLVPGATISSVQRALHVNAPTAMRLLSIREAIASVPTAEPEPCVWRDISTAPKDETPIRLKWAGTTVEAIGRWCPAQVLPSGFGRPNYSDDWRDVEGNDVLLMPTHWKPVSLDDSDEWKPLPAPVSPVEPESSSFEANTASNLLQKVELSTLDRYRNTNQMDVDTWMVRAVASSEPRSEDDLVLLDHVIALLKPTVEPEPCVWRDISTAPKVHPLQGGSDLLLAWVAPGIGEWVVVVGCWRDGWWSGSDEAYPTLWAPVPRLPGAPLKVEREP